uniref:Uncharacterized protein n=1 Tax=Acrobeloides nanus TaxID=290746 RepID=A0A914CKF4_9BILA
MSTISVVTDNSSIKYERQRFSLDSFTDDEIEKRLNNRCCCNKLNILTSLQLLALTNFLLDGLCTYLSVQTVIAYGFALSSAGSLLCLCAVISAVQEEKQKMMAGTVIWVGLKSVVLTALWLTAVAAFIDFSLNDETYTLSLELKILLCIIPFSVFLLCLQWWLSRRVTNYIQARDEFYVIPSAAGSFRLRDSLRKYLGAKLAKIDVEKY